MKTLNQQTHNGPFNVQNTIRAGSLLVLSAWMTACGSGDSSIVETVEALIKEDRIESIDTVVTDTRSIKESTTTLLATGQVEENNVKTSDLQAPEHLNFTSHYQIEIDLDISHLTTGRAYFSICKSFTQTEARYNIDYNDCLVRSSMIGGVFQDELQLSNTDRELVAEVWLFEQNESVQFYVNVDELADGQWVMRTL